MYDITGKSIMQLKEAMENGETTSCELVLSYMERIRDLNGSGPARNAIREWNGEAVAIAMAVGRKPDTAPWEVR